jgi:inorganic pyrophosphatase/exopolyphosphatase
VGGFAESEATSTDKKRERKPMTLAEMELALARIDAMIGFLKNRTTERTDRKVAADIARYQEWRDDLDVQIGLERIKHSTDRRRTRSH